MKIKFIWPFLVVFVCLIVFLLTTFVPAIRNMGWADTVQGFSLGAGFGALTVAILSYFKSKKSSQKV
ncbi:MAG: hypothetical protein JO080_01435 [Mucilaginibacter sp.]|nr:hypothetical protein [Mucilaginibacter sp.]